MRLFATSTGAACCDQRCGCAGVGKRGCSGSDRALFNSNLVGLFTEEYQRATARRQRTADTKGLISVR